MVAGELTPLDFLFQTEKPEGVFKVTMLPGDGVGPELMHSVKEVFKVVATYSSLSLWGR